MPRFLPVLSPAVAMVCLIMTGLTAKGQGTGAASLNALGTQAAVFGGGQAGTLPTGMVAVQWPTQVTLDGDLQILAPDYRILRLGAGRFVVSGGQIYADPAALLSVGYPQDLLQAAGMGTTPMPQLFRTPAPTAASLLASASNNATTSQIFVPSTPSSTQMDDNNGGTLAFTPLASTAFGNANTVSAPATSLSFSAPEPRSMAFAPPSFAVPGYQARDGAYYVAETSQRGGQGPAATILRAGDQGRGAFASASPISSPSVFSSASVPTPESTPIEMPFGSPLVASAAAFGTPTTLTVNGNGFENSSTDASGSGGMFDGIQQSVAAVPWFVWAGAAAATAGVTVVILND